MASSGTDSPPLLARRTRKRLIVCTDGSWQSSETTHKNVPSNVTRLARSFAREDIEEGDQDTAWEQVVFYDSGVGTGEISEFERIRQGGFGHGFVAKVIEAYNFIVLNWYPGDKVYCFGFSRGAYTARAVAGLVNDIGIISPRDMQDFPELFDYYQSYKIKYQQGSEHKDPHGFRKSAEYRNWVEGIRSPKGKDPATGIELWDKVRHQPVLESSRIVEVVGVFDTVGSLGVPESDWWIVRATLNVLYYWWGGEKPGFHNVNLSLYIRNAFHAVALDEHRRPFSPTLWHMPDVPTFSVNPSDTVEKLRQNFDRLHRDDRPSFSDDAQGKQASEEYEEKVNNAWAAIIDFEMHEQWERLDKKMPNLKQVWFPGRHVQIGGGDDDLLKERCGDFEQMALISFAWMVEQVRPFLKFERRVRKRTIRDRMALIVPVLAEAAACEWKDYGAWMKPFWKALDRAGIYKAPLGKIARRTIVGWAEGPMPESYTLGMKATGSRVRTPGDYRYAIDDVDQLSPLGETNEYIHPSIQFRKLAVKDYNPRALEEYTREWDEIKKQWFWSKQAQKQDRWLWQTESDIETICIPEWTVRPEDTFSRFLTRDYMSLVALSSQEGRGLLEDKASRTAEEREKYEAYVEMMAPSTKATHFLDLTNDGKEWVELPRDIAKTKYSSAIDSF